jgi:hypothetical protein
MSRLTLEERVAQLERQNRRLKLGGLAAIVMLVALNVGLFMAAFAASIPRGVVSASRLVVHDGAAPQRAILQVKGVGGPLEGPELALLDSNGHVQATLKAFGPVSELVLSDRERSMNAMLLVEPSGPRVVLNSQHVQQQVALGIWRDGPALLLSDGDDRARISLRITPQGPELVLVDAKGNEVFRAPK